uniref:Uncharacterized protein n=1 Tax=Knipowitschia caucasica TaxID=637954 RepID=A0AAV2MPJ2_KNICA
MSVFNSAVSRRGRPQGARADRKAVFSAEGPAPCTCVMMSAVTGSSPSSSHRRPGGRGRAVWEETAAAAKSTASQQQRHSWSVMSAASTGRHCG